MTDEILVEDWKWAEDEVGDAEGAGTLVCDEGNDDADEEDKEDDDGEVASCGCVGSRLYVVATLILGFVCKTVMGMALSCCCPVNLWACLRSSAAYLSSLGELFSHWLIKLRKSLFVLSTCGSSSCFPRGTVLARVLSP